MRRDQDIPNTIKESVPKVKNAFLPTGNVISSMLSASSSSVAGSTNGSISMEDARAIGGLRSFALSSFNLLGICSGPCGGTASATSILAEPAAHGADDADDDLV